MKTKKKSKKNNKTKKNFEYTKCGPLSGDKIYTCYNSKQLIKLRNIWNTRRPDKIIKENDSRTIWSKLREYLNNSCTQESCWLRHNIFKHIVDKSMLNVFSPLRPGKWDKNPKEWLTGEDIEKVMKQYEKKYKHFEFIGPTPIDYDTIESYGVCVWEELCKFNLQSFLKRNIKEIGIIFNLDKHTGPGTHWVSMFIDIPHKKIYYYDSVGDAIPKQINKLVENIKNQQATINTDTNFKLLINKKEHQKRNSECGVYSLHFIISMLTRKISWESFQKTRFSDDYINKYRDIYFNDNYN